MSDFYFSGSIPFSGGARGSHSWIRFLVMIVVYAVATVREDIAAGIWVILLLWEVTSASLVSEYTKGVVLFLGNPWPNVGVWDVAFAGNS